MSRRDSDRLSDISEAITAIHAHLGRGELGDSLIFDAVRVRLIEIGEAVKAIDPAILAREPGVPWKEIARMRDRLTHHYFDTDDAIVADVVDNELDGLAVAVARLRRLS